MLRAIIIDDEPAGIKVLRLMIEKYPEDLRLVASSTSAEEGIILIEDYKPDVVFLDISMPEMNGFEMLEKLNFKEFNLVFTTAHKEYALQAIKNKAFDYLLKPIDAGEFKKCVQNLIAAATDKSTIKVKTSSQGLIEVQVRDGIIFVKQKDIISLEASGSYTIFHLVGSVKHLASKSIKEFEVLLDTDIFCRCHHSYIVNLNKVEKFVNHEGFYAQMDDSSKIEISRRNKDVFLEKLKNI